MSEFVVGGRVRHYELLSVLGRGGMGEVFLALDTRLDRKVALKVLPRQLAFDSERLRRFTQEAKAASALNHPNILTIYDIGEQDHLPYMAAEFVDGETLRGRARTRLNLREALDIIIQVAAGLSAAHEAGIVHRDIKPENIMVRRDGYVKILDFGLAKLTERAGSSAGDTQAMTQAFETRAGVVMGTAAYMSPEQARGLPVDARSDIFSLGVVLYELVASRPPFEGETPSHLIVAILEKQQPPLAAFSLEASPELERIVAKCLAKHADERYQTIKDLLVDLKQLRRSLDHEGTLRITPVSGYPAMPSGYSSTPAMPLPSSHTGYAAQPSRSAYPQRTPSNPGAPDPRFAQLPAQMAMGTDAPPADPPPPHPVGQDGIRVDWAALRSLWSRIPRKRRGWLIALFVILLTSRFSFPTRQEPEPHATHSFENFEVSRLTTSGNISSAAIAPEGNFIAYVQVDKGDQSLWIRQTDT
ncbi:MAG TPA: protein kinase, partial [Bryobacteraceae bacterium]|nr:protein kinase [Bryobacteraceae bacterium]